MHRVPHTIRLIGRAEYGREAPPIPVGNMLRLIGPAVRQSILMGFLGRSRPPGRPPTWLASASDIRFVGIDGGREGETILHFEAPRLGDCADELYRQQESWPSRPPAEDTGLDLLCDILGDVSAHRADSDRFDSALLRRISGFGQAFDRDYQRAVFAGNRYTEEQPAILDERTIANAHQLTREIPRPQRARVVGVLDMIRMSSQGFELLLDDDSRGAWRAGRGRHGRHQAAVRESRARARTGDLSALRPTPPHRRRPHRVGRGASQLLVGHPAAPGAKTRHEGTPQAAMPRERGIGLLQQVAG